MSEFTPLRKEITSLTKQLRAHRRLLTDQEIKAERDRRHAEIMGILSHHIGRQNAIGMGELYKKVYNAEWTHRINDTRPVRKDIVELRNAGNRICYTTSNKGGYYIPATESEWRAFIFGDIRKHAHSIRRDRIMYKISNEEAMRQVQLVLQEGAVS